ncbi:MAG: DUF1002 domain-containing protein [Lachnospiraceae bacterium]|nr:DUF1002 domain-containing protein [Lachnospiraceae bacterium]
MKRFISVIMASVLTAVLMIGACTVSVYAGETTQPVITFGGDTSGTEDKSKPYLALGSDLTQEQLASVLSVMGLSGTDLSQYNIVYVTNAEEHQYLDQYIDPAVIGTRSLSSVLVKPAESGHGITVNTYNINYCTTGMYKNALLTAGVENADITVAAPSPISGTAGLIGALKAYADMKDEKLDSKALDTSLNELVTTGQIEEALNGATKEDVEEMIAFIKAEIAGKDLNTREEIDAAVRKAISDYNEMKGGNWNLSEDEIRQIVDLMVKIKDLGLDYNQLLDQAADIYEKFGSDLSADDLGAIAAHGVMENIKEKVGGAFRDMYEGVKGFFSKLFGG